MKYPNARISTNNNGKLYYIHLYSLNNKLHNIYLTNTGEELDWQTSELSVLEKEKLVYFKTKKLAQEALDKVNITRMKKQPKKKPITLTEIKSQFAEAKKLIGKRVIHKDGKTKFKVSEVKLYLENAPNTSSSSTTFYGIYGYVIQVGGDGFATPFQEVSENKEIIIRNHSGASYTAVNEGDFWVFGCAKIDKSLIRAAHELLEKNVAGNRTASKVTIGAADFDKETLKRLVEQS